MLVSRARFHIKYYLFDVPCLIDHAAKLHELPDEYLSDVMPIAKKIALAQGIENYNILQVNFIITMPLNTFFRQSDGYVLFCIEQRTHCAPSLST
jgi:hypothetical protein